MVTENENITDDSPRLRFAGRPSLPLRGKEGEKFRVHITPPSAEQLRAKAGRTMVACVVAGALANLAEARGLSELEVRFSSPWFRLTYRAGP